MALKLVKLDNATLPAIANAIREKTGDTALLLPSQMPNAIASIQSGGDLPSLTSPAAESDVLSGKEYIDGNGDKKSGTLVVCDSVEEVGTVGVPGVGLSVDIESPADGSAGQLTLPEENLKSENIKSGTSIFNVAGSVKEIRTETGTITPAEDTTTITIPCSDAPKYAMIYTTSESMNNNDMLGVIINNTGRTELFRGNCLLSCYYSNRIGLSPTEAATDRGIIVPEFASYLFYRAGVEHQWIAYYWE